MEKSLTYFILLEIPDGLGENDLLPMEGSATNSSSLERSSNKTMTPCSGKAEL